MSWVGRPIAFRPLLFIDAENIVIREMHDDGPHGSRLTLIWVDASKHRHNLTCWALVILWFGVMRRPWTLAALRDYKLYEKAKSPMGGTSAAFACVLKFTT